MRVLVCGSRTFQDEQIVWEMLSGLFQTASCGYMTVDLEPFVVIHGGAKGADFHAATWAFRCPFAGPVLAEQPTPANSPDEPYLMVEEYRADWKTHGRAAGPIRNQQMLTEGKPDVVLAFVNKPLAESRGTADMVRRARDAGVKTYVVEVLCSKCGGAGWYPDHSDSCYFRGECIMGEGEGCPVQRRCDC